MAGGLDKYHSWAKRVLVRELAVTIRTIWMSSKHLVLESTPAADGAHHRSLVPCSKAPRQSSEGLVTALLQPEHLQYYVFVFCYFKFLFSASVIVMSHCHSWATHLCFFALSGLPHSWIPFQCPASEEKADSSLTPHRPSEGPREPGPSVVKHQMDTGVSLRAAPDVAAEPPAHHVEDHSFKAILL